MRVWRGERGRGRRRGNGEKAAERVARAIEEEWGGANEMVNEDSSDGEGLTCSARREAVSSA
jgi:hypothetical protein